MEQPNYRLNITIDDEVTRLVDKTLLEWVKENHETTVSKIQKLIRSELEPPDLNHDRVRANLEKTYYS
tara:strand:- start:277 stop:480 length:204 start_codon:yes stop_codon:yes gene_type:complete